MRLFLVRVNLLVPCDLGLNAFADAGRVFIRGDSSDDWHPSGGGGVWIAPLERTNTVTFSVAASGGITTAKDVLDTMIAGADVAMITSEIYRTGPDAIAHILEGIVNCLQRQRIDSFKQFVARNSSVAPSTSTRQV